MPKSGKIIQEAYDMWHRDRATSDTYDSPLKFPWYESVFREVRGFPAHDILEVGCGQGDFALLLREEFAAANITAIDFSQTAIQIGTKKSADTGANIRFMQANAESLPFEDESFDLVISCECMEHVDKPRTMARELARVAKPAAKVCLTTENYLNGMLLARVHAVVTRRPFDSGSGIQPKENLFFFWTVQRHLQKAGLIVERTESCYYQWLLLPGVAPSRLCTKYFANNAARWLAKPFGRHFSFFARKPEQ